MLSFWSAVPVDGRTWVFFSHPAFFPFRGVLALVSSPRAKNSREREKADWTSERGMEWLLSALEGLARGVKRRDWCGAKMGERGYARQPDERASSERECGAGGKNRSRKQEGEAVRKEEGEAGRKEEGEVRDEEKTTP
jgi:hypothetical protein